MIFSKTRWVSRCIITAKRATSKLGYSKRVSERNKTVGISNISSESEIINIVINKTAKNLYKPNYFYGCFDSESSELLKIFFKNLRKNNKNK